MGREGSHDRHGGHPSHARGGAVTVRGRCVHHEAPAEQGIGPVEVGVYTNRAVRVRSPVCTPRVCRDVVTRSRCAWWDRRMPVDYDRDAALPLRVPPELRARLDAVRSLAPAWAPLSRNGAGVAAILLGLDALETALRADPTAAARMLAGETITTSRAPARPAAAPATARPEVDGTPPIEPRDTPRDRVPPPSRKARATTEHVEGDDAALRARLAALLAMEPDKHPRDRAWNMARIARAIDADGKSLAAFRDAKPGLGPTYRRALAALLDGIDAGTATPPK